MNGDHKLLESIADKIIDEGLRIRYVGYARLDSRLTPQLIAKLARSGCKEISFGLESGSQRVLNMMRKGVSVKNYEDIIKNCHRAGIQVTTCVIVGFPGEMWRDFFLTLLLIFKLHRSIYRVNLSILTLGVSAPISTNYTQYGVVADQNKDYREWYTQDRSNTLRVRLFRYWVMKNLWKLLKNRKVSENGWDYEYGSVLRQAKR